MLNHKSRLMRKTTYLRRCLVLMLCLGLVMPIFSSLIAFSATNTGQGEIRARLLRQIREEGWDPYSASMSMEEFYALMDMFEDGTLPLRPQKKSMAAAILSVLGFGEPVAYETDAASIPRTMFMVGGLKDYAGENKPQEYDNTGNYEPYGELNGEALYHYPAGLDPNNMGYMRPPNGWNGVGVTTDKDTGALRAAVIVDGINDNDPHVVGDVKQELFPKADGYYVRSVSAEGGNVSVLGVIDKGDGDYVYYYMSMEEQSTLVSSTTLQAGVKFIINYSPNEHEISYKIEMSDGSAVPADITPDSVFGEARPTKTVDAAYSFNVIAPYGYTVQVFRMAGSDRIEITGTDTVNNGYPLGAEPVYKMQDDKLVPDTGSGPMTMTRNATFYNDSVAEDRTVVAVLTKSPAPRFDAFKLIPNTDNTKGRGTSAFYKVKAIDRETGEEIEVFYDYEDVYEWANDRPSKYDYVESSITAGKASKGNVKDGNVATADSWGWNSGGEAVISDVDMDYDKETDSYYYQWTFQTNSGEHYLMDTLEINGVAISIPYFPKKNISNVADEIEGEDGGLNTWFAEGTLPDGAKVRVEMLMSFTNNPQHVYRITVTGAHSNVTLTNMNLMQFRSGAQEIAVYKLDGVHADDENTTSQLLAIEHYTKDTKTEKGNEWKRGDLGAVLVDNTNYDDGDIDNYGANIRFKLADGYGEPYYLLDKVRGGLEVINGQASATRQEDGSVTGKNPVQSLEGVEGTLDSRYIYGPDADGWYYIRLTGQKDSAGEHKMALLTIIAVPVKYVVRYVPSGDFPEKVYNGETYPERSPVNMPVFDHTNSDPSFTESPNGWQYDDNNGFYYDTVTNNKISITTTVPSDPKSWYKFVDWVIVDAEGKPVQRQSDSQTVSLYSDDPEGEEEEEEDNSIHITSNRALTVTEVNEYSIENDGLGGNAVSVRVIRLMPTWKEVINPFKYSVVVDWVDSIGELHQEHFEGYWDDILTDTTDKDLTVFVNKDAEPLQRWLKEHPTYDFWDEVNNAVDDAGYVEPPEPEESAAPGSPKSAEQKIEDTMNELYPELARRLDSEEESSLYNTILKALLKTDIGGDIYSEQPNEPDGTADFSRLGGYAFSVHQNGGKIVIWMCEKKSGLEIRNDLQGDAFSEGEEFYYTINAVSGGLPLEGIYKAYPEGVPGDDGNRYILRENGELEIMLDSDAWLVKFEDGKIADIIKNDGSKFDKNNPNPSTYFTFEISKDERVNKGIILYAPVGDYTVTEVGSKSGGAYKVKLDYYDWTTGDESNFDVIEWNKPEPEDDQWIFGSEKGYIPGADNTRSQVSVGIEYKEGSNNRLYVIQFTNQTSSLTIGNEVEGGSDLDTTFSYEVKLKLSDKIKPLKKADKDGKDYYYFNYTPYLLETETEDGEKGEIELEPITDDPDGFNWKGVVDVANHRQLKITTSVPIQPDSEQPDPDEPGLIKRLALKMSALLEDAPEGDDSEEDDSEQTAFANYSVHELELPEMYSLENITTTDDSSIKVSVDDSNASGILAAVDNHSLTFHHIRDITLPETGYNGIMSYWMFGIWLIAAVAAILIFEAKKKA